LYPRIDSKKILQNCRMRGFVIFLAFMWLPSCWAAHAYAQFGDIKYPANFKFFDYVNPQAPRGGELVLVPPSR